jgi:hypothetical protein
MRTCFTSYHHHHLLPLILLFPILSVAAGDLSLSGSLDEDGDFRLRTSFSGNTGNKDTGTEKFLFGHLLLLLDDEPPQIYPFVETSRIIAGPLTPAGFLLECFNPDTTSLDGERFFNDGRFMQQGGLGDPDILGCSFSVLDRYSLFLVGKVNSPVQIGSQCLVPIFPGTVLSLVSFAGGGVGVTADEWFSSGIGTDMGVSLFSRLSIGSARNGCSLCGAISGSLVDPPGYYFRVSLGIEGKVISLFSTAKINSRFFRALYREPLEHPLFSGSRLKITITPEISFDGGIKGSLVEIPPLPGYAIPTNLDWWAGSQFESTSFKISLRYEFYQDINLLGIEEVKHEVAAAMRISGRYVTADCSFRAETLHLWNGIFGVRGDFDDFKICGDFNFDNEGFSSFRWTHGMFFPWGKIEIKLKAEWGGGSSSVEEFYLSEACISWSYTL